MSTVLVAATVALAAVFGLLGTAKALALPPMRARAEHLGYSVRAFRAVGLLEVAGATGLVVGLAWRPLTLLAAAGLVVLLVGAVVSHARAGDPVTLMAPALVFVALTIALAVATGSAA